MTSYEFWHHTHHTSRPLKCAVIYEWVHTIWVWIINKILFNLRRFKKHNMIFCKILATCLTSLKTGVSPRYNKCHLICEFAFIVCKLGYFQKLLLRYWYFWNTNLLFRNYLSRYLICWIAVFSFHFLKT